MNLNSLPQFRDVVEEKHFTEPFIRLDDILDKPMAILDYVDTVFTEKDGKRTQKVHILIEMDKRYVISTGSIVLAKQVKEAKSFPFAAKIVKVKSFYSFENI